MGAHTPNRHSKGTSEGGRFAPDEVPAVPDVDTLTLETPADATFTNNETVEDVVDPVAALWDKMKYDKGRLRRGGL